MKTNIKKLIQVSLLLLSKYTHGRGPFIGLTISLLLAITLPGLAASPVIVLQPDAFWSVTDVTDPNNPYDLCTLQAPFGSPGYSDQCGLGVPVNTIWSDCWTWSLDTTVDLTGYDLSEVEYSIAIDNNYQLYVNGNLVQSVSTGGCASWQCLQPLPGLQSGNNDIRVVISGDCDFDDYFSMVIVANDSANPDCLFEFPDVSITSPADGSEFTSCDDIVITANAFEWSPSGPGNVAKVDFYQGTTLIGTVTQAPYTLDLGSQPPGSYTLTARATDAQGNTAVSAPVTLTVNSPAERPAGMTDWWPFDGNTEDIVGYDDGTANGDLEFSAGEVNQAGVFNGSAYVSVPNSPSINVGAGGSGLTVEAWIKPTDAKTDETIFEWVNIDFETAPVVFNINSDGSLGAAFYNPNNGYDEWFISSPGVVKSGVYQHVTLTYDESSGTATIYLNGSVVAQDELGTFTPYTVFGAFIGAAWDWESAKVYSQFAGQIDEVSVYNRALTSSEIQCIYDAGTAGKSRICTPSGAIAWWPAEGNTHDVIGGNRATITGGVTYGPGQIGQGFQFDGVTGYIDVASNADLDVGQDAGFTIEGWVNPSDLSQAYPLLEWANYNEAGAAIELWIGGSSSGGLWGSINYTTIGSDPNAGSPAVGSWQHVAMTFDKASGNALLYLNGVKVGCENFGSITPATTGDDIYIGVDAAWSWMTFPGSMDEITVYNRALTPLEIESIFQGGFNKCEFSQ